MSEINIKQITTESRNQNTMDIDKVSTMEILQKINAEDKKVPLAVERALPQIKLLVDRIVEAFENKGRLIYIGAGTSGRIGVLDASECPPTFGVDQNMVIGLIAGGKQALVKAVEQAEDSKVLAVDDLKEIHLSELDVVVGIAASGRTPYVIGGIEYAQSIGASCGCITTSRESILAKMVDFPIEVITGAEAITGSTRMKSGTAQKLVCNMLTTASMIKLGKVYQNLMVDLKATNEKLVARSIAIICETTDYNKEEATKLFYEYHDVKAVILSYLFAALYILGSAEYTASIDFPRSIISAFISVALNTAAVSVVKYGCPVPHANITTLPLFKCFSAFLCINGSAISFISIAVCTLEKTPLASNASCNANPFIAVASIPI